MSGLTTKMLALTGALGNFVRLKVFPGQHSYITGVPEFIEEHWFAAPMADWAFDADQLCWYYTSYIGFIFMQNLKRAECT